MILHLQQLRPNVFAQPDQAQLAAIDQIRSDRRQLKIKTGKPKKEPKPKAPKAKPQARKPRRANGKQATLNLDAYLSSLSPEALEKFLNRHNQ